MLARFVSTTVRRAAILGIFAGSFALNATGIDHGLPGPLDRNIDAIHPFYALDAVRNVFGERSDVPARYPRLHFLVVGTAQIGWLFGRHGVDEGRRLYAELSDWVAHPPPITEDRQAHEISRRWATTVDELIVVGRMVSALMGTLLVVGLFLFARSLSSAGGGVAAALASTSFPLVYYSHVANVDVPYLCWTVFALHSGVRFVRDGGARWWLSFCLLAAAAGATKDQAFSTFAGFVPLVLFLHARPGALAATVRKRTGWPALGAGVLVAALFYALAIGLLFDARGVRRHFEIWLLDEGSIGTPLDLSGQSEIFLGSCRILWESVAPPVLFAAIAGAGWFGLRSWRASLLAFVPAVSHYATLVAPVGYCELRFLLPLLPSIFVAAAFAIGRLLHQPMTRILGACLLVVSVGWQLAQSVALDRLLRADPRPRAEAHLAKQIPAGRRVAVFRDAGFHSLTVPPNVVPWSVDFMNPSPPPGFGTADYVVVAAFDPILFQRRRGDGFREIPHRQDFWSRPYLLEAVFQPISDHPIRSLVRFQPTVVVYRRD